MSRTFMIPVVGALLVLSLAACSGSDHAHSMTTSASDEASFNADDVMFAQMMIPHHEQALEMSAIALDETVGASEDVRRLATTISAAQDPEVAQMTALLTSWGESVVSDHGMDHGMADGMLSAEDLGALGELTGAAFDRAWLVAMTAHHEGAITMAEVVLASGSDPEIRALATAIVDAQKAEIAEMRTLMD